MAGKNERNSHRRVVTGHENGKSIIQSDERLEAYRFKAVPGFEHTLLWENRSIPDLSQEQKPGPLSAIVDSRARRLDASHCNYRTFYLERNGKSREASGGDNLVGQWNYTRSRLSAIVRDWQAPHSSARNGGRAPGCGP